MKWRLIELEENDAFTNMAIDEAVSKFVSEKKSPPTIRFYKWKPSAVSIGYFQSMNDEVNVEACKNRKINFIRRRTGGGSVYHDNKGEITYSVIAPEELFPKDITKSYHIICGWIVDGLKALGFNAEFKPINDIVVDGKKISGNAQTRREGVMLQHGTLLYNLDIQTMFTVLKVGVDKISDKMIKSVEERVTCIKRLKDLKEREVYEALKEAFTKGKDYEIGKWNDEEMKLVKKLVKERYTTTEWNFLK